jgi:hypothetical protein
LFARGKHTRLHSKAKAGPLGAMGGGGASSPRSSRKTHPNGGTLRDHGGGGGDGAGASAPSESETEDEPPLPPHVIVKSEMIAESKKKNAKSLEEIINAEVATLRDADGLRPSEVVVVVTQAMQVEAEKSAKRQARAAYGRWRNLSEAEQDSFVQGQLNQLIRGEAKLMKEKARGDKEKARADKADAAKEQSDAALAALVAPGT